MSRWENYFAGIGEKVLRWVVFRAAWFVFVLVGLWIDEFANFIFMVR